MNIVTDTRQHETGLWDDVVCAVRDDLRAFWGLWDTHIAPRIDSGLPVTYNDAEQWNGDNVDVAHVFSQLRCLTRKVKAITDAYIPRTSIEERVLNCVQSLIRDLRKEKQATLRMFVEELMVYAAAPDFVYPRPVD
jgi:Ethanolamine utilization protein EutJ (predicted chaperonin)